jgi:hypothetical protein
MHLIFLASKILVCVMQYLLILSSYYQTVLNFTLPIKQEGMELFYIQFIVTWGSLRFLIICKADYKCILPQVSIRAIPGKNVGGGWTALFSIIHHPSIFISYIPHPPHNTIHSVLNHPSKKIFF